MQLVIDPEGTIRCVYDETIDLAALGTLAIQRGSHVEPDAEGRWWVDLSPVGGVKLGPFSRRSQALRVERLWLESYWLSAATINPASAISDLDRKDAGMAKTAIARFAKTDQCDATGLERFRRTRRSGANN